MRSCTNGRDEKDEESARVMVGRSHIMAIRSHIGEGSSRVPLAGCLVRAATRLIRSATRLVRAATRLTGAATGLVGLATLLACAATLLTGCAGQARTMEVPVELPPAFSSEGTADLPARWWTAFEDAGLNAAVDSALSSNFDLKAAWERLRAAQAVADRQSAALWPQADATAAGEIRRGSGDAEEVTLALSSFYEVDLWGRIRSSVDAERFRAEASLADYQTAALSLSAEIARTWYRLAEATSQVALLDEQVATNTNVLDLLQVRFQAGMIPGVDVLRQRQLVEARREQRADAVARLRVLEHQLAVLLGRAPQEATQDLSEAPPDDLPELAPLPEPGIPIELVRRRPDIRRAFYLLRGADRDLASAISSRYPRLTLSASASSADGGAERLFESWVLSVAGDVLAPIFYGGELRAEADRAEAVRQELLYEYGQAVLIALQEVEDALIREEQQAESNQHLENQIASAVLTYEQLQVQYLNGAANYIDVLIALAELQDLQRRLLTAELAVVEYRIALYRALAGSFETVPPPEP